MSHFGVDAVRAAVVGVLVLGLSLAATTAEAATPKHKRLLREADTGCFMEKPLQWVKKI
jgi:hypothetical protein